MLRHFPWGGQLYVYMSSKPAFQAPIFVESGTPVDPDAKLQRRERQAAEASRPRQLSVEEVALVEVGFERQIRCVS